MTRKCEYGVGIFFVFSFICLPFLEGRSGSYFGKGRSNSKPSPNIFTRIRISKGRQLLKVAILLRRMEEGARHRNNTEKKHPGGGESDASSEAGSGGGGVALKKEIGLVSACGIIVGEFHPSRRPLLCPLVVLL